ncbi:MAG: DUF1929 domain-containing protein [Rubrivivax sp.]|nr:MAG: DUF1929 domain-containing protein [Rubrivivax sp.]
MARVVQVAFKALVGLVILALALASAWWFLRQRPVSPDQYHVRGKFGPVVQWPLIPLQVITLPDGRVMSYGTDAKGNQTGQTIYDVWDPSKGFGPESHLTLPNQTGTDLFCSGEVLVPADGAVLLVGGDLTVGGKRNWSSADINFFDFNKNVLKSAGRTMERPRWYPTVATLGNGDVLVVGGKLDPNHYAPIPEIYSPQTGWRTLPGAEKNEAYGEANWSYPRLWLAPSGKVFNVSRLGETFFLDTEGQGKIIPLKPKLFRGHSYLPSLMYAPGKVLSMRMLGIASDIDMNTDEPVVKSAGWYLPIRFNAMATVLADGQVFLSGGGLKNDDAGSPILSNRVSEIWNPQTRQWHSAGVAQKDRLYHSVALLMQDATVLTGAGGAGYSKASNNLDIEIYYPPYLFKKDGSGQFADRPKINQAPAVVKWGEAFDVQVQGGDVSKVSLVQMGSATHAQVYDQRFMDLSFSKKPGGALSITSPATRNLAPPGYYYLFVFDAAGVPSVAKVIRLNA